MTLDHNSLRILGSLMEKEMTTPDLYPLSLNALQAAANQRSSREPVMDLDEDQVRAALEVLEAHELVAPVRGSRVPRYEHRIRTVLSLRRDETAVLCLLLLRGAQTAGELRGRSERMFSFDDLAAVQAALDRLAARETPLTAPLPRVPGSREVRHTHLLGDESSRPATIIDDATSDPASPHTSLSELIRTVEALSRRVEALEAHRAAEAEGAAG